MSSNIIPIVLLTAALAWTWAPIIVRSIDIDLSRWL
jgi:hypothetical protein